ncbi:bifunctional 4-hydroxy-2-oxoglutarate aldolase/2-dehydro-3-deoxy-phosphogluconate aldolase [Corallincola spongiicola]|uniref:2-dehydro-3-deoxy-phosphogluconate aldolase n=1 Tax=Corallincola spongiicola TaxID=2520508 RepID=A0ABY1WPQ4_9GAMM|nr:bifunctional 4-hydroxy-2-oxoglutarate aldolase/2-dehydro-3-deoxy-phosphogluconate aldolase [Corallincola spongiicola]TAA45974.1 bifunctional 4-hydroxy-2-oxoglutarate aldolase/2-dehydro-3-deoxy-phosphogluconate aldolase [Corallincola spongiicola]
MDKMQQLIDRTYPVLPVMVIKRLADAVPLATALAKGGINVFEVTLRTACALDAIKAIKQDVPDALVGAGTVCSAEQLLQVQAAGADFAVSPGLTDQLAEAAVANNFILIPGVSTPSEVMRAQQYGFNLLKFFPAAQAGGVGMLKAFAGPFGNLKFCPTGGISEANAADYLALDNVVCVGGSWVCPNAMVEAGDWQGITDLAKATSQLD